MGDIGQFFSDLICCSSSRDRGEGEADMGYYSKKSHVNKNAYKIEGKPWCEEATIKTKLNDLGTPEHLPSDQRIFIKDDDYEDNLSARDRLPLPVRRQSKAYPSNTSLDSGRGRVSSRGSRSSSVERSSSRARPRSQERRPSEERSTTSHSREHSRERRPSSSENVEVKKISR